MAVFGFREIADADLKGFTFLSGWRKQPTQATGAGIWFDLSMSPGNPRPNNYIGESGVFTPISQSTGGGIPHGANVAPKTKYLRTFEAQSVSAAPLALHILDYLGYYPFIDESVTEEQLMDNTIAVPRLPVLGAEIMPVVVAGHTGGQTFTVGYTNHEGVSGRVTPQHIMGTQTVNGTILTSGGAVNNSRAPFMALQAGDVGVRKVDSVIFEGVGDIGLVCFALVNPIAKHYIRETTAPAERDYFTDDAAMPIIPDDAYLNLLALPSGNISGAPIIGYIKTLWC